MTDRWYIKQLIDQELNRAARLSWKLKTEREK